MINYLIKILSNSQVLSCSLVLKLSIQSYADVFFREYYYVRYRNGTTLFFMTCNEPDVRWDFMVMHDDFVCFRNFDELIQELSSNVVVSQIADWNRKLPGFFAYELSYIDKRMKSLIRMEIKKGISGYARQDLNERETRQISLWVNRTKEAKA